jgi:hypothetical protein
MADALLLQNVSLLIGIHRVDHARLLAEHQHSLSLSERNQDGRIADVEIGSRGFRAVRILAGATHVPRISALGHLIDPLNRARLHVERNHGIAGASGWIGVIVSRSRC